MSFLSEVKKIESAVRETLEDGAVTPYYSLDRAEVYKLLNAAIASEIICVLRYQQHYYMTTSIYQEQLQQLFKEHWQEEQSHLERIAERLKQLGGVPNFNPEGITARAFSHFQSGHTLADLLREDLVAERVVIKLYGDYVTYFGAKDATTRRLFEDLLAQEEEHADELADQLFALDPETGKAVEQFTGDRVVPMNGGHAKA
jgi:bacterioferritin